MEISFEDKAIRAICESEARARRALGTEVAEVLKRRLADLSAATSISDLAIGNLSEMIGGDGRVMTIDLCAGHRILFCANHVWNPRLSSGKVDWSCVSRIKILQIEKPDA